MERGLSEFRGKIGILDSSHRLLKQCIGRISNGEQITNSNGKMILHLYVTFVTIIGMLDHGIQPFFVFEGRGDNSTDKNITCNERKKVKDNARKKCNEIEDKTSPEYLKNLKKCFQLTSSHYQEVRKLLDLAGIPYVIAPGEGDPQCAAISKYYKLPVITDDTDILAFGGAKIWKDFSLAGKKTHELDKQTILEQLYVKTNEIRTGHNLELIENFTHSNFVDYCIMLGTDYTPDNCKSKISGVSVTQLFELFVLNDLDVEKTCEYITLNLVGVRVSANFIENWRKIKQKYLNTPVIHPQTINVLMRKPKLDELVSFLCDENGLDKQFVMSKITSLEKDFKLFNDVYSENLHGHENDFGNFTSYRLKYGKQRHEQTEKKPQQYHERNCYSKKSRIIYNGKPNIVEQLLKTPTYIVSY